MSAKKWCSESSDGFHCGHWGPGGETLGNDMSGHWDAFCCHCGVTCHIPWEKTATRMAGHGPHYVYQDKVFIWPKGWSGDL
jgi:hypothetical protein